MTNMYGITCLILRTLQLSRSFWCVYCKQSNMGWLEDSEMGKSITSYPCMVYSCKMQTLYFLSSRTLTQKHSIELRSVVSSTLPPPPPLKSFLMLAVYGPSWMETWKQGYIQYLQWLKNLSVFTNCRDHLLWLETTIVLSLHQIVTVSLHRSSDSRTQSPQRSYALSSSTHLVQFLCPLIQPDWQDTVVQVSVDASTYHANKYTLLHWSPFCFCVDWRGWRKWVW